MGHEPVRLTGERVWRTYIGGGRIPCLSGKETCEDGHFPEEWMYSVTKAANAGREEIEEGLCRLDDGSGRTLKEWIEKEPEAILGTAHVKKWGVTPGVLIKIIDSKERLTVQVHPDKETAKRLFGSQFGKTECWHILDVREDMEERPCIYLGFKEGITREVWVDCFREQDYDRMLSLLNRIEVKPGETYLVKGGVPHAIGSGCMLIEIQEPTDYTIRVERVTPSGFRIDDRMCHQGLGFDTMFECFSFDGADEEEIRNRFCLNRKEIPWKEEDWEGKRMETGRPESAEMSLCGSGKRYELVGYEDTPCFRMERLEIQGDCFMEGEGIFSCLYILSGEGMLETEGNSCRIKKHDQFFVPADAGKYRLRNQGEEPVILLRMYGPKN